MTHRGETSHERLLTTAAATVGSESAGRPLRVRVSQRHAEDLVVTVDGEVDATTVGDVEELLWPRLSAVVSVIVVDLTAVTMLDVPGLQLLTQAHMHTQARGIALRVATASLDVGQALHAAGLDALVDCYSTVSAALQPEGSPCDEPDFSDTTGDHQPPRATA